VAEKGQGKVGYNFRMENIPGKALENISEKKRFSVVKRAESFTHAGRGIWIYFKATHNAWLHFVIFVAALVLGFYLSISRMEWMFLVLASGFVFVAEAFNSAIEVDIDLTSPEYHPYARDTKDIAAGAVLISAITAVAIGLFIFVPYF
jgi:diacylglycerol kinase (ATP)